MWKVVTRHEIFGFFSPKRVLPSSGHPHTVKITPTGLKLHPQHENYTHRQWKLHPQHKNYTHSVKITPTHSENYTHSLKKYTQTPEDYTHPSVYYTLTNVKNQCFSSYPVPFHPLDTLIFKLPVIFKKCTQWPFTKIFFHFSYFSHPNQHLQSYSTHPQARISLSKNHIRFSS